MLLAMLYMCVVQKVLTLLFHLEQLHTKTFSMCHFESLTLSLAIISSGTCTHYQGLMLSLTTFIPHSHTTLSLTLVLLSSLTLTLLYPSNMFIRGLLSHVPY